MQEIDIQEGKKDWDKTRRDLEKEGIKNGISDGRDSNFEKSFNEGFQNGFRNAFALGQYKGAICALLNHSKSTITEDPSLQNPTSGSCAICSNQQLLTDQTEPQIIETQTDICKSNLIRLYSLYTKDCNVNLPNSINFP